MLFLVHYNRYGSQELIQLALDLWQLLRRGMLDAIAALDDHGERAQGREIRERIFRADDQIRCLASMEPVSPSMPASRVLSSVAVWSAKAGVTPQYFTK